MLTTEQQEQVLKLRSMAYDVARRYCPGDDEAEGEALVALCEAVHTYQPGVTNRSLTTYAWDGVTYKVRNYKKKKDREQRMGLSGGFPTLEHIEHHNPKGRKVRKGQDEYWEGCTANPNEALAAPVDASKAHMEDLICQLPKRLQPLAHSRYILHLTVRECAQRHKLSLNDTMRKLQEAQGFAQLIMNGGPR